MSWSVSAVGKPAAVKVALAKAFESAKNSTKGVPHENASVTAIEQIVNGELDFLAGLTPIPAVQVSGSGSAYKAASGSGSSESRYEIKMLHGFVE